MRHTLLTATAHVALLAASVSFAAPTAAQVGDDVASVTDTSDATTADDDEMPLEPLVQIDGVDLTALGLVGDAPGRLDLEALAAPIEGADIERIYEISIRLSQLEEQQLLLTAADEVLADALVLLELDVAEQTATRDAEAQIHRLREERVLADRRRVDDRARALDAQIDMMGQVAVAAYVRPPDADTISAVIGGDLASGNQIAAPELLRAKWEHDIDIRDWREVQLGHVRERLTTSTDAAVGAEGRLEETLGRLATAEATLDAHREAQVLVRGTLDTVDDLLELLGADLEETSSELHRRALALVDSGLGEGPIPIVVVEGFRVHVAIAPQLNAMILAAREDGIELAGWGYRTTEQQIFLRMAHCGPTPEDIYLKPAGECSPPTAPPGASMHEVGLAVDFTHAGASIGTRGSPAYQWLAENAGRYGFLNLPSEPWHWSVNGS